MEENNNNEATLFELDLDRSKARLMADSGRAQALAMRALRMGDFEKAIRMTEHKHFFLSLADELR